MAEISKITLPSGTVYDIKDAYARQAISAIVGGDAIVFKGVSSTQLTDGGNQNPTVDSTVIMEKRTGDLYFYGNIEFIYGEDNKWHQLGDLSSLGSLAYKNNASGTYTPNGSVDAPTISLATAGSTTTIKNPTKATVATAVTTAAPGATAPNNPVTYYSVSNQTLSLYQIGYDTGDSITTNDVTVKTGDGTYESSAPSFSGVQSTITVS